MGYITTSSTTITSVESLRWAVQEAGQRVQTVGHQGRTISISVALMRATECVVAEVPMLGVPEFLNILGELTVSRNLVDVQFFVHRRGTKSASTIEAVDGGMVDIDVRYEDFVELCGQAGIPLPLCAWHTHRGGKHLYVFDNPWREDTFQKAVRRLTLATPGGDPRSWLVSQAQRLPRCWKTTPAGLVLVEGEAVLLNPIPLPFSASEGLPHRLASLIGSRAPMSQEMRSAVETNLDELGIPAPDHTGSILYDRCPDSEVHDSKCCYVNRRHDGSIFVHCLGGHDGTGPRSYSEQMLLERLGWSGPQAPKIDPIKDVPLTLAGDSYVHFRLRALNPDAPYPNRDPVIVGAVETWREEKINVEAKRWQRTAEQMVENGLAAKVGKGAADLIRDLFLDRLRGFELAEPYHLEYSVKDEALRISSGDSTTPVKASGDSLALKSHQAEWKVTEAFCVGHSIQEVTDQSGNTTKIVKPELNFSESGASDFNKARIGVPSFLAKLGIASVDRQAFPAAFARESWDVKPGSKIVNACIPCAVPDPKGFDTINFFLGLFRDGRLPLATENDVLLFVAALASPLLRFLLVGLLGLYWMTGPPGAGKDFLAEILGRIWKAVGLPGARVKFDLTLSGEMEMRRSFAMTGGAVYARAKEAGKQPGMTELLIRTGGTDQVAGRGLYADERPVNVDFTIIADSAEDIPDRREIHRRTVPINVAPLDEAVDKGAILREIAEQAPLIIGDLCRRVEAVGEDYFLLQSNTQGRPLGPAGLAKMLGAALPDVRGGDLSELFELMADYTRTSEGTTEGQECRSKARGRKDSTIEQAVPSYRLSHFLDTMRMRPGGREVLDRFRHGKAIVRALYREAEYARVKSGEWSCLTVDVAGEPWAFRLCRGDRNLIFVPEAIFLAQLRPLSQAPTNVTPISQSWPPPHPSPAAQQGAPQTDDDGGIVFSDADLLTRGGQ